MVTSFELLPVLLIALHWVCKKIPIDHQSKPTQPEATAVRPSASWWWRCKTWSKNLRKASPEKHVTRKTFHSLDLQKWHSHFFVATLFAGPEVGTKTHVPKNLEIENKNTSWNKKSICLQKPLGSLWKLRWNTWCLIWESQHTLVVPMVRMPMAMVMVVTPRNVGIVQELLQIWREMFPTWDSSCWI